MSKVLTAALWIKFSKAILLFGLSFSLNFIIFQSEPSTGFILLLWGKPLVVLIFILLLNLLFRFPGKVKIPNLIPSTFLVLSFLIFADLGYLIWRYFDVLAPHTSFWTVYALLGGVCVWNLQKYVRAFTVGV